MRGDLKRQRPQGSPSKLQDTLQWTWNGIGGEMSAKLVDSMPRRLMTALEAKEGPQILKYSSKNPSSEVYK